jgi:AraC-like DNA-binding protein
MAPRSPLPSLAFGNASAVEFRDEYACGEFLAQLPDAPSRFGATAAPSRFHVRLHHVTLPGVSLVTGANSGVAIERDSPRPALVIPLAGCQTVSRDGRREIQWAAPHHALFIPAGTRIVAESATGSFLRLDLVEAELLRTASGIMGCKKGKTASLDVSKTRPVPLKTKAVNWLRVVRSLAGTIDAFNCDGAELTRAGLDDVILRTTVMMLSSEAMAAHWQVGPPPRGFDLDPLLEQIVANLSGRVTLGDMEKWSGLAARSIQQAFHSRFGVTPMKWVRERRLDSIYAALKVASPDATVADVADAHGLPRMATLIPHYVRRFGELPSETLRGKGR